MTLTDFIINLVSSSVVSLFFVSILIWFVREWISARLKVSIQHEYDQKLEAYKAQLKSEKEIALLEIKTSLEREAALHAAAQASFSEGQKASMERRLNSIDMLWGNVLMIHNAIPPLMYLVDVLTIEEYEKNMKSSQDFRNLQISLSADITKLSKLEMESDKHGPTEKARPYVGEYTWALFVAYYAIMIRAAVGLFIGKDTSSKIEWFKDNGTRSIIEGILSQTEIEEFDSQNFGKFKWIQQIIESKILDSLAKVISGENFSVESLSQAMAIQRTVSDNKLSSTSK